MPPKGTLANPLWADLAHARSVKKAGRTSPSSLIFSIPLVLAILAGGRVNTTGPLIAGVGGALVLVWVLSEAKRTKRRLRLSLLPLGLTVLGLYCLFQGLPLKREWVALLSEKRAALAPDGTTWLSISYEPGESIRAAAFLFSLAAWSLAVFNAKRFWPQIRRTLHRTIVLSSLLSLAAGLLLFQGIRPINSSFVNGNHSAAFFSVSALLSASLFLGHRTRGTLTWLPKRFWLALALALGSTVLASSSRAAQLELALFSIVGFVGVVWFRKRNILLTASVAIGLIVVVTTVVGTVLMRLQDEALRTTLNYGEKLAGIQDAPQLFRDHWVAGVGRGAYLSIYPHYKTSIRQLLFIFPENILVQYLSEWGAVVGSLALFGLLVLIAQIVRQTKSPCSLFASLAVLFLPLHDLVDFSTELVPCGLTFIVLASLTPRAKEGRKRRRNETPRFKFAWCLVSVALISTVVASFETPLTRIVQEPPTDPAQILKLAQDHPNNHILAEWAATIKKDQGDYKEALSSIDRAVILAPHYVGPHAIAAEVLIAMGYRRQGFGEVRLAWERANYDYQVAKSAAQLARNAEEYALAIPTQPGNATVFAKPALRVALATLAKYPEKIVWSSYLLESQIEAIGDALSERYALALGNQAYANRAYTLSLKLGLYATKSTALRQDSEALIAKSYSILGEKDKLMTRVLSLPENDTTEVPLELAIAAALQLNHPQSVDELVSRFANTSSPTWKTQYWKARVAKLQERFSEAERLLSAAIKSQTPYGPLAP